jgi:hypothetical protein
MSIKIKKTVSKKRRSINRRKRSVNRRRRSVNRRRSVSRTRTVSKRRKRRSIRRYKIDGRRVEKTNYMKIYLTLKKIYDKTKDEKGYVDLYTNQSFLDDIENIEDIKGIKNRNLLMLATEYGNYEFISYFVNRGIDINDNDIDGNNVLFLLDYSSFEAQMIFNLFLNKGINIFHKNFSGKDIFNYLNQKLSSIKDEEEIENITEILAYLISWYYSIYVMKNLIDDADFIKNVKSIIYIDPEIISSTLKLVDKHINFLENMIKTLKSLLVGKNILSTNTDKASEYINEKLNCKLGKEIIELIRMNGTEEELKKKFRIAIIKCEELIIILNIRKDELNKELYKIQDEKAKEEEKKLMEELEIEEDKKDKERAKKKAKKQRQKQTKLEKESKEIASELTNDIINKSLADRERMIQNMVKNIVSDTVSKSVEVSERNTFINDMLNDIIHKTSLIAIKGIKDTKDEEIIKEVLSYTTKRSIDETNNLIINLTESDIEEEEDMEDKKDPIFLEQLLDLYIQQDYAFKNPKSLYKNLGEKLNYINKRIHDSEHVNKDLNKFLTALEEKNSFLFKQIIQTKNNDFIFITKALLEEKINFLQRVYIPFIMNLNKTYNGEYIVLLNGLYRYLNEDIQYYNILTRGF